MGIPGVMSEQGYLIFDDSPSCHLGYSNANSKLSWEKPGGSHCKGKSFSHPREEFFSP